MSAPIDFAALLKSQQDFQASQMAALGKLIEALTHKIERISEGPAGSSSVVLEEPKTKLQPTLESISREISEFVYDPENDITFETWYSRYEDIFTVEAESLDDKAKIRLLLRKLHTSVHLKYINYILPKEPKDFSFLTTVEKLKEMFGPQQSLFSTRYNCLKLVKSQRDDIVTYAAIVNRECERFKYKELSDDQFKCLIFISGLQSAKDAEFRLRLLNMLESEKDISVSKLVDEYKRLTSLKQDAKMVENVSQPEVNINAVHNKKNKPAQRRNRARKEQKGSSPSPRSQPPKPKYPCLLCGAMHFMRECSFADHKCEECGKVGHKEGYCTAGKNVEKVNKKRYNVRSRKNPDLFKRQSNGIECVNALNIQSLRKYANVIIRGSSMRMQIDTASDITLISKESWNKIGAPVLERTDNVAYGVADKQNPISFTGTFQCTIRYQDKNASGTCYVAEHYPQDILGLDFIEKLDLWDLKTVSSTYCNASRKLTAGSVEYPEIKDTKVAELLNQYAEIWQPGLGHCKQVKASLRLRDDAKPIFRQKRPVPFAALASVEEELNRLEQLGVITKVDCSGWAAPIVVVRKANGNLRICADFSTGLNDALELHQYPLPLPETIFATLNGGRIFSQIDFADAYLQIEMEDKSKELLTINTHRGLYRYNRLPFGVKSAPGIFQQIMDTMLAGLNGAVAYLDDVIVVGKTEAEHRRNLEQVFKRIRDFGFRIRPEKCHFLMPRVKYLGYIIDKEGRHPDPEKIRAIKEMPVPTDISSLRSFLGLINYYGNFVKEMRTLRAPLDVLLKKNAKWHWTEACQKAFERAKSILGSDLLLTHFDPKQEIVVAADASNEGIGAVILHRYPDGSEKAIAHASRSLTNTEKNYSQIEKEALGLIFAVKKFHRMIHGRKFVLLTDHKPLLAIFGSKKGIPVYTANRLQRWATTLLGYNFEIQYRSTSAFGQADALSRLIANNAKVEEDFVVAAVRVEQQVLKDAIRALPVTANMIAETTKNDPLLKKVLKSLQTGWPKKPSIEVLPLYRRRESLSLLDGCILFQDRVVIPERLQQQVLSQLHSGHPGIVRMKSLARSYVYWPGLDKQIEEMVKRCARCASVAKCPVKATLASWPIPERPWSRVHIDYAGPFEGHHFLIIVDAYSKWPEVCITDCITTKATVSLLHQIFARFGMPEVLVSDNGTQFASAEFEEYCAKNGIEHIRSPAYHPQSNGQAERFVDTFKRSLLKIKGEKCTLAEALQTFLMSYRSSPNVALNNKSPSEMLLGRRMRTALDLLKPIRKAYRHNEKMEKQFNRHHGARPRSFAPGTLVYVLRFEGQKTFWVEGRIIRRRGKVLYEVAVGNEVWIRHVNHMQERHVNSKPALNILLDVFGLGSLCPGTQKAELDTSNQGNATTKPNVDQPVVRDAEQQQQNVGVEQQQQQPQRKSTRQHKAPRRYSPDPVRRQSRRRH